MEGDDRASGGTGADARIVSHSAWLAPVLVVYYLCCWPQDAESGQYLHNSSDVMRHLYDSHLIYFQIQVRRGIPLVEVLSDMVSSYVLIDLIRVKLKVKVKEIPTIR